MFFVFQLFPLILFPSVNSPKISIGVVFFFPISTLFRIYSFGGWLGWVRSLVECTFCRILQLLCLFPSLLFFLNLYLLLLKFPFILVIKLLLWMIPICGTTDLAIHLHRGCICCKTLFLQFHVAIKLLLYVLFVLLLNKEGFHLLLIFLSLALIWFM